MTDSTVQAPSETGGAHLVLYDGVCGLCSRLLQFLLAHDGRRVFNFASLQSPAGQSLVQRSGGDPHELSSFYVVAHYRTRDARVITRGRAALFVAGELGWPWKATRLLGVLPTALLDGLYDLVARNRYRLFGRHEQCLMPRPEFQNRFVDREDSGKAELEGR
jgi:predicted DCC family thiol-disulfide oxidoreductase YuxK